VTTLVKFVLSHDCLSQLPGKSCNKPVTTTYFQGYINV